MGMYVWGPHKEHFNFNAFEIDFFDLFSPFNQRALIAKNMTALNRKLLGVLKQLNTGKYAGSVLSLLF